MSLERSCARVARAYPDRARRAEVAATLAESSAGRRRPRTADALNVLWHGAATRVGGRARAVRRAGAWGDAAAVAVVQLVLMQAVTAVALAVRAYEKPAGHYPVHPQLPRYGTGGPMFYSSAEACVAVAAALLAVGTAVAACRGRVWPARAGALTTALAGLGAVAASRLSGNEETFTTPAGRVLALLGMLVATLVLGTRAVARAAAVVPRWWWRLSAAGCGVVAVGAVAFLPYLGDAPLGRGQLVATTYAAQAALLVVLALPLARRHVPALGGAALVGCLTVVTSLAGIDATGESELARQALAGAVAVAVLLVVAAGLSRRPNGPLPGGRGRRRATAGRSSRAPRRAPTARATPPG